MEFSEFAHKLASIIGQGVNTSRFTRTLFETMVMEEHLDLVSGKSKESFKAYFNGNTKIVAFSKEIIAYIEPEQFVTYINDFSDAVIENLSDAFREEIPDINNRNCSEKIAYLFQNIIKKAAATTRVRQQITNVEKIIMPPLAIDNSEGYEGYSEADNILLQEFTSDYDEIVEKCISENFAQEMLDKTIQIKIEALFNDKWSRKSEQFQDIMLKSNVLALLAKLNDFCSVLDPKTDTLHIPIRLIRRNLRNLYIKLHPSNYSCAFPYDVFIKDWNEGENY